ncbi:MAG: GTP-binding protein, partial [Thermoanaerobaculia bacterium]
MIRNVALTGHSDTGKTTLASALLYTGGVVNRLNKVEDGNTITDFDSEEIDRGISIGLAVCFTPWKQHKINLLDCPGYGIFFDETRSAMRAADAALLCINAASGVEVTSEKVWDFAAEIGQPVMIHLTKMDRERAELRSAVEQVRKVFGREVIPIEVPIGTSQAFEGVIDLINDKATVFTKDGDGKGKTTEIPEAAQDEFNHWKTALVEAVAETDDALLEKFFEAGELSADELREGLRRAVRERKLFPVTLSSALHGIGPASVLEAIVETLPSPIDRDTFPAIDFGGEEQALACDPDGKVATLVFKTLSDPFTGKVSLLRVVSGRLASDTPYWNFQEEMDEKVGHLMVMQGKTGSAVPGLATGDIGGVAKLKHAHTGNTLCEKDTPVRLAWL